MWLVPQFQAEVYLFAEWIHSTVVWITVCHDLNEGGYVMLAFIFLFISHFTTQG